MYDADKAPDPSEWLERDEDERIIAVEDYHRRIGDDAPNELLHATFHVVVENQLAGGEDVVVETMRRLRDEGLTRHDAVHAIGSVLAEHMYDLMKERPRTVGPGLHEKYFDRLGELTAEKWRAGG